MSLSARRAWIEINLPSSPMERNEVALRKESVDRNSLPPALIGPKIGSLSARRAWIEILLLAVGANLGAVALRKESVDRNA